MTRPSTSPPLRPARALVHPAWLTALALLILNDHLFKSSGLLPAIVTGKLSDVAGLALAPALLATLLRLRSATSLALAHLAIGVVFAAIKLSPAAAAGFESLMALTPFPWHITLDPTDLVALPALAVSYRLLLRTASAPITPPSRALTTFALSAGLVASMATSPPPVEPGFPSVQAHLVIGAPVDATAILRIRPLRDSVTVDCAAALRNPSTAFSRELFADAIAWQLEPGRAVQVIGDGFSKPGGECFAALVDGTLHRARGGDGQPIPLVMLFWTADDFPFSALPTTTETPGPHLVLVDDAAASPRWRPHSAIFPAPPELDSTPRPGCEPAPSDGFIDWDFPIPTGLRTILAVESSPDGCHRLTFPGDQTWFLCTGTVLPFRDGDTVHVSRLEVGQSFEAIDGIQLLGDGDATGKRLVAARGSDLAPFGAGDWSARDEAECGVVHGPCGNLVVPQRIAFDAGTPEAPTEDLAAGDALDLAGGTFVLHRAERIPIGDSLCIHPEPEPDGLALESVYFEPRAE